MDQKGARQRRAAEQRAEQGTQWWSARPFGFAYEDGRPVLDGDGKPTLDLIEADLIRGAYTAVLAGSSLYAITEDWNNRGIATPRGNRWRGSQVRQLLLSPRKAGLRTFRNEIIGDGGWPAIVDAEIWQGVADKLADPARRTGLSRARRHLLSGIATCGLCGSVLGSGVTSRPRQNPIYTCKGCNRVSRNAAQVDAMAVEAVVARLSRPDAIELTIATGRDDLDEQRKRARALRARLDGLATEFADGDLTASQIKTATRRINEQLAEIDAVILDAQKVHTYDGVIGAHDVDAAFDALDLDRKRAIVAALITVTVHPTGRGKAFDPASVDVAFK